MYDYNPIRNSDIVFLGNSLTESFDLVKHFGRNDLRNRGMSGNMTDHILYRLEEITNAKPQAVYLMIGINDLYQGISPDTVYHNILEIIKILRNECPETRVFLQSILPVNEDKLLTSSDINTKIYELNDHLETYYRNISNVQYIDLHSYFLNNTGSLDSKYTYDGVHLSADGYVNWAQIIQENLKK